MSSRRLDVARPPVGRPASHEPAGESDPTNSPVATGARDTERRRIGCTQASGDRPVGRQGSTAAGLLPPRLRAGYRLSWGWREQHAFSAARLVTRTAVPALPAHVRYWPHYLSAQRRLQRLLR